MKDINFKANELLNPVLIKRFLIIFGVCIISACAIKNTKAEDSMPLDESIRYGRLANGFTYFLKPMAEPQPKLLMRLYNKAGAFQQDKDQFNIAHAVEHLAFKETKNFPEGIRNNKVLIESGIGKYDLLAFNGSRATEYYFDAPVNNGKALEVALQYFKDIATGLVITEKNVRKVTGDLRQEYMEGAEDLEKQAAISDLEGRPFPCDVSSSTFVENHEYLDPDLLRRFYEDWYRPDLMAISIVGNIADIDALEQQIKKTFSGIIPPENPRQAKDCDSLYYSQPPQFHVVERTPSVSPYFQDDAVDLRIIFRDPLTMDKLQSLEGIQRLMSLEMLIAVLGKRFEKSENDFDYSEIIVRNIYKYNKLPVSLSIEPSLETTEVERKFREIIKMIRQLQEHGVSREEFSELKQSQLRLLEFSNEQKPKYWIKEIEEYFVFGEAFPTNKNTLLKRWINGLTLPDFNLYVSDFFAEVPEDIGILAPTGHPALRLNESEVRSWIKQEYGKPVEPFLLPATPEALMNEEEVANLKAKEIQGLEIGESGAIEYVLNNGLKLVLKKVKPEPEASMDEIIISGFALRGANCFPEDDFFSAVNAADIVVNSGVNGLNKFEISRFLRSNGMLPEAVSPYIDYNEVGIEATATSKSIESVLQLIHLYFTKPNKDPEAFKNWKFQKIKSSGDLFNSDFNNGINSVTGDNTALGEFYGNKFSLSGTKYIDGLEQTDINVAHNVYEKLFTNAQDFTFVITSNSEIASLIPLFLKYLGNLPSGNFSKSCLPAEDIRNKVPVGPATFMIPAPEQFELKNIKYCMKFLQPTIDPQDWQEQLLVEALGVMTREKMWTLRFDKNFSLYSVVGGGEFNPDLKRYEFSTYLDCVPEEFPELRKEAKKIISSLRTEGVEEDIFQIAMQRVHRKHNLDQRGGRHPERHQFLYEHYRNDWPWIDPSEVENYLRSLTPMDIKKAAKKYFAEENQYEFIMMNSQSI